MSADQVQQARDGAKVWIQPPALFLVAVLLGVGLDRAWEIGFLRGSVSRILSGLAIVGSGASILLSAFAVFRRIRQHPDPRKPTPSLSRDGPYRYTRNPMYVGGSLIVLGIGIALGNAWILLLLVPVVLIIHYGAILPEERYLEQKFGEEYNRFKASVRRWI